MYKCKDKFANFINKVKKTIPNLLNKSGAVLYSNYYTLKKDDFYILGFNPGGDPREITQTIMSDLESEIKCNSDYSEYSVKWKIGNEAPLQKNIKLIAERILKRDVKTVCSSNLLFVRSKMEDDLGNWKSIAEQCWKVHEFLIYEIILPKVIISFGIRTFNFLIEKFSYDVGFCFPAKHGNWKINAFITKNGPRGKLAVIGFPHLSRYRLYALKEPDLRVIENWLRKLIYCSLCEKNHRL